MSDNDTPTTISDADRWELRALGAELREATKTHQAAQLAFNAMADRLAAAYKLTPADRVDAVTGVISRGAAG